MLIKNLILTNAEYVEYESDCQYGIFKNSLIQAENRSLFIEPLGWHCCTFRIPNGGLITCSTILSGSNSSQGLCVDMAEVQPEAAKLCYTSEGLSVLKLGFMLDFLI